MRLSFIKFLLLFSFISFSSLALANNPNDLRTWNYRLNKSTYAYKKPRKADIEEWQKSAIHQDLINLNLISLPEIVLDKDSKVIAAPFLDIMDLPYERFEKFYGVKLGKPPRRIWTYSGYDVNLKPSKFREYKITEKYRQKYEHDSNSPKLNLAKVSYRLAKKVFPKDYKKIKDNELHLEAKDFWEKVFDSKQSIILTEGHKKALSLLSFGLPAISVTPNCFGLETSYENGKLGLTVSRDMKKLLSYKKRKIYFHFDSDKSKYLKEFVFSVKLYLAKLAKSYKHDVKIIAFENLDYKACDDLIYAKGFAAFEKLLKKALSIKEFEEKYPRDINYYFDRYKKDGEFFNWCFEYNDGPNFIRKEIFKDENLNNLEKKKFSNGSKVFVFKKPRQKHIQEWKESAISKDLIDLNLISIPDLVLSSKKEFISYPFFNLIESKDIDFFEEFDISKTKSEREIWTFDGYKLSNPSVKQDRYEIKVSPSSKVFRSKYEHSSSDSSITLAKVSYRVAKIIFPKKYREIAASHDNEEAVDFWDNVFASNKTIVLTEGHKKALSLLSHGVIAFTIHQKCLGFAWNEDDKFDIANDLKEFLSKKSDRLFLISFDTDGPIYIRKLVLSSAYYIAKKIKKNDHDVKIIVLPDDSGKGADDFIVRNGFTAYKALMDNALTIKKFKKQYRKMILKMKDLAGEYLWCNKLTRGYWYD